MNIAAALRAVRAGRDKAAYYRMWHVRERAGLPWPTQSSPHAPVSFEVALLALGKESGKVEDVVRLLAEYFAIEDRMVLRILKRATYPMFTALVAAFIAPLPLLAAGRTGAYGAAFLGGLTLWFATAGALLLGAVNRQMQKPRYVLGRLLRALTIAVEAGLPLGRAVTLAAVASGNEDVIAHVRRTGARAAASQPLATTFDGCPHVPFTAVAAMKVADATGDYSNTLRRLAILTES